jgi:cytochrome b561
VHIPHLHLHLPTLTSRLPVATVLLSVVYAAAIAVALTAPGQHAAAGCAVLAGLVSRTVVRRRRSAPAAVAAATAAVDALAVLPDETTAPATAA